MKKRGKKRNPNTRSRHLSGWTMCFNDSDPIGEPCKSSITQLPCKHENPVFNLQANSIYKLNLDAILHKTHRWQVSFTPISMLGGPMAETTVVDAVCTISQITGTVESFIETVMSQIDMEFYKHFNFECKIGGGDV